MLILHRSSIRRFPPSRRTMLIPLPTLTRPTRLFLAMMSVAASSPCASAALLPLSLGFVHRRAVHLPSRKFDQVAKAVVAENNDDGDGGGGGGGGASDAGEGSNTDYQISVTGTVYELEGAPTVKLFTKQGCTLCDRVKDVSTIILEGIGVTLVLLRYHKYFHIIHSPFLFLSSTHLPPCLSVSPLDLCERFSHIHCIRWTSRTTISRNGSPDTS